ncbi:MAG: hypothetical protein A3A97_00935 [Candidatus Terrybacteria bacterium RIFCSPLOWO2_01_FULL_40_23]|uniref:PEGA domain-containing protein n=1 Tax=Candidatus Terrybacteria bacterium RIFCSPLOWO2_01_FULL_40_23 TaxID=1802366 RepID=A0A1G2PSS3_9BACT|nr:MAG: hypothetical protein A3A97_00935 [Candidatus Terrybacteria bacterium RIFCSPLOWO2_01_FULL_40_23]
MSRIRFILLGVFIFIFTIAASTMVLYANGWRFSFSEKKLVQTGAIFLNMNVREAKIFINNELQKTTSPISSSVLLNNILPGIKKIRIEKDGFLFWEKEMRVEPQQTNRFLNILLLPKEIKTNYLLFSEQFGGITDFFASPDGNIIAIQQKDKKINLWNRQKGKMIENKLLILPFAWSGDNSIVLTKQTPQSNNLVVFMNMNEEQPTSGINIPALNNPKILIDNEKFIIGTINKNIDNLSTLISVKLTNKTDASTKTRELVRKIKTFAVSQGNVYFIDQQYILWRIKPDGSGLRQISKSSLSLGTDDNIELITDDSEDSFAIRKIDAETLWIFNPQTQSFDHIAQNVLSAQFSPNSEKLMLISPNEIYVYFIKETFAPKREAKTLELITRLSGRISNSWWHPQNEHLLFEYDASLQIIELNNEVKRNGGLLLNNYIKVQETKSNREIIALNSQGLFLFSIPKISGLLSF